jgi:UDP-N-acetyl-D-glucosamine dehydrogenase
MPIDAAAIASGRCTVAVVGLGYVGLPLALSFAEAGLRVIGLDIDPAKPRALLAGRTYLRHVAEARIAAVVASGKLTATTDFSAAAACDAAIICVPTPLDKHLAPDLGFVEATSRSLAPHLGPGTLVALESTSWPGTTMEVVRPIIEAAGRIALGRGLYLCFSPEREDPGNARFSTRTIPKLVGGADAESLALGIALYGRAVDTVVPTSDMRVAEAAKLLENIFRSVNIALVNELKVVFDRMGIDVWEVIRAASTKPFGFMPFYPGPGLGGHCIPIDPFYLTWKAREFGVGSRFIELAGEINRGMPGWVVGKVAECLNERRKALKGSRVLVLGLAYKPDIDDIRESPSLELIERLETAGASASYHDPHVAELHRTREFPALSGRRSVAPSADFDCFLLATAHREYVGDGLLRFGVPVVDTRNALPRGPLVYPA